MQNGIERQLLEVCAPTEARLSTRPFGPDSIGDLVPDVSASGKYRTMRLSDPAAAGRDLGWHIACYHLPGSASRSRRMKVRFTGQQLVLIDKIVAEGTMGSTRAEVIRAMFRQYLLQTLG